MAPKKRKADTNNLKQASSYKSKLRPRKEPAILATALLPPKIFSKRRMPSKKNQSAVHQPSSAKDETRETPRIKRSEPPPNKRNVSSKKREVADVPPSSRLSNVEREKYSIKDPYPQQYSFPENIIFYASRNPLFPAGHLKLMKSCKSLFRMSRIVPVYYLHKENSYDSDEDDSNKETSDVDDSDVDSDEKYDKDSWEANYGEEFINFKNQFFKLWIYDELYIDDERNPNLASTLVKRIHLSTLKDLTLEHQHLTFDELQIIVNGGKLEKLNFDKNIIRNVDSSITEFGKVFDAICCRNMIISLPDEQNGISKITSKKIVEVLESEKATLDVCVRLMNVPEAFDFEAITGFLKANMDQGKHTIDLEFAENLSDSYKNGLQKYVNEIIKIRGIYAHTLPRITFPGEDITARRKLQTMRYAFVNEIRKKPGTDRVCRMTARKSTGGHAPRRWH